MPAHFSNDFDLEAIRFDLNKVLGALTQLLPPKPVLTEPTLFDAPKLSNEHYYSGGHGINRKPRPVGISTPADAMTPSSDCTIAPHPVEPFANYPLRTDITIAPPTNSIDDSLDDSLRAEVQELRETLRVVRAELRVANRTNAQVMADAAVLRIELRVTRTERDVLARKLAEIYATAAPSLTSKLTPVELP